MLQSLLISNSRDAAELIARAIRQSGHINLAQVFCPPPTHYQLSRALSTQMLDVVFVETTFAGTSDAEQVRILCDEIKDRACRTAIIGFSTEPREARSKITSHALKWPLSSANLCSTVRQAVRETSRGSLENLFSVIPAKGGSGGTTITVNLACQLATTLGRSVLVAEADLRSGTISDWLGTKPVQSIAQSLACADDCLSLIWPRHVSSKYGVDWMLADRDRNGFRPFWGDYRHLLSFASARYDCLLVDLPDTIDEEAAEVALLSHTTFVVTTPEMLSLELAGQRIEELEFFGVPRSRVQVLVNRVQRGDIVSPNEIQRRLGCEIGGLIPNDYPAVHRSIFEETFVSTGTKLGRAYCTLARSIAGEPETTEPPRTLSMFGFLTSPRRSAVRAGTA